MGLSAAKEWAQGSMKGLWTSPMIPMTADGEVDHAGIRHNVDFMVGSRVDGVGFGFSELWYLTIKERMEAFKTFVDAVGRRVPAYLHALDYSVPETISLIRYSQELGASAVMLWTPMEFAKSQEMACEWYEYVASQVTSPIFAYNTYHSGMSFTIETIERLADIENICALKDAVNDFGHTVAAMEAVGDRIVVSNPLEKNLPAMRTYMGQQVLLGTTSVFLMQSPRWQPIRDYLLAIDAGDSAAGWASYYELEPLREIWNGIYEPLWEKKAARHPVPFIKLWMDRIGMRGGTVRRPMHELTSTERDDLEQRLDRTGLLDRLAV